MNWWYHTLPPIASRYQLYLISRYPGKLDKCHGLYHDIIRLSADSLNHNGNKVIIFHFTNEIVANILCTISYKSVSRCVILIQFLFISALIYALYIFHSFIDIMFWGLDKMSTIMHMVFSNAFSRNLLYILIIIFTKFVLRTPIDNGSHLILVMT